jgi:hypothetical protein
MSKFAIIAFLIAALVGVVAPARAQMICTPIGGGHMSCAVYATHPYEERQEHPYIGDGCNPYTGQDSDTGEVCAPRRPRRRQ